MGIAYLEAQRRILAALGLTDTHVRSIRIDIERSEPITVYVERFVHDDEADALVSVFEEFVHTPRPAPDGVIGEAPPVYVEEVGPHGLTRTEEQTEMRAATEPTDLDDTGEPW